MLHPAILRRRRAGGNSPWTADWYVDSVSGNDGNDGLTEITPFETLSATGTALLSSGSNVALIAGSTWRENLDLTSVINADIRFFGAGNTPYVDAAGVINEIWYQPNVVTYPNVYAVDITHGFTTGGNQSRLPVWEDSVLLVRVTSLADCNTTAGSFYSPDDENLGSVATATVNVHASDSGNPASNGSTYETSRRQYCIQGAFGSKDGQSVIGPIKAGRQAHNDGAITLGTNSILEKTLIVDGHKHNALQESGTATDCIFHNAQQIGGYLHVFYASSGAGLSGVKTRCGYIGNPDGYPSINVVGSYSHDDTNTYGSVASSQQWFVGLNQALANGALSFVSNGAHFKDCAAVGLLECRSGGPVYLRYSTFVQETAVAVGGVNAVVGSRNAGSFYFQDNAAYVPSGVSYGNNAWVRRSGTGAATIDVSRNTLITLGDLFGLFADISTEANTYTIKHNIRVCANTATQFILLSPNAVSADIDYNIYYVPTASPAGRWNDGTGYVGWAAWQAKGYDTNSLLLGTSDISLDDLFLNGTAGLASGDFRLATDTGLTFGDGTPIHEIAGQQTHWDWDARGTAPEAAATFPSVPTALADCDTYVQDPPSWAFYPSAAAESAALLETGDAVLLETGDRLLLEA